jgi:hypothetical protein
MIMDVVSAAGAAELAARDVDSDGRHVLAPDVYGHQG